MTREEKCQLAIEKGIIYNPETGKIFGIRGKELLAKTDQGYITINISIGNNNKIILRGHQFAWYWVNKECVDCLDHIDGNILNNRIKNLRNVTNQQNNWNRTNAKGYNWHKCANKWRANISFNNKTIYLGLFEKEEDARAAYLEAKEKYHII